LLILMSRWPLALMSVGQQKSVCEVLPEIY
jgi:hypothetical protein